MANQEISSINDLKKLVTSLKNGGKEFVFRGQSKDWTLLPKIARENYFSVDDEIKIFNEFKEKTLPYIIATERKPESFPNNDFEWLTLGQHYGLKTRYLDWTRCNEVALFFAVDGIADGDGIVWIYELPPNESDEWLPLGHRDILEKTPFQFNIIKLYHPKSFLDTRTDNQYALVSIHPHPWKSMETIVDNKRLIKLSVLSHSKKIIRNELYKKGVNYASLFMGIKGICRDINSKYDVTNRKGAAI